MTIKYICFFLIFSGFLLVLSACKGTSDEISSLVTSNKLNTSVPQANFATLRLEAVGDADARMASFPAGATTEMTPLYFKSGKNSYMITTTGYSTLAKFLPGKAFSSVFEEMQAFDTDTPVRWITHPAYMTPAGYASSTKLNSPSEWEDGAAYWKRLYLGISDIQPVSLGGKEFLLCIGHGENKNEKTRDGRKYLNTVLPKRAYSESEFSGVISTPNGVEYRDNPDTYFAFVTGMLVPADRIETNDFDTSEYDLGPIVWPSIPYVRKSGSSVNGTVKHPSIFVKDQYCYLYYIEQDYVRVARAELQADGTLSPFYKLVSDKFDKPALPEGFDKSKRIFLEQGSAEGDKILGESGTIRFSVAKLEGTPYYIGVQENAAYWPLVSTKFHVSKDLVHWSSGTEIPSMSGMSYTDSKFHYPILCDKNGNQKSVDPKEFYLLSIYGSSTGHNRLYRTKLSVSVQSSE